MGYGEAYCKSVYHILGISHGISRIFACSLQMGRRVCTSNVRPVSSSLRNFSDDNNIKSTPEWFHSLMKLKGIDHHDDGKQACITFVQ